MLNKLGQFNKAWMAGFMAPIADWLVDLADKATTTYLQTPIPDAVQIALASGIIMLAVWKVPNTEPTA
jgi:hypothetical protein